MAIETGTATDHHDLLDKLETFLVAEGWTVNNSVPAATLLDSALLEVTGPGFIGGQQPNISIATEADSGLNAYAWKFCAYPTYDSALDFGLQNMSSAIPYYLLWPNAMDYWFYVNDRRFIVVVKIGVYYMSMYAGFFLPYALPAEYPFPYFIAGSATSLRVYNENASGIRAFVDPGPNCGWLMSQDSASWTAVGNHGNTSNTVDSFSNPPGAVIWPFRNPQSDSNTPVWNMSQAWFNKMRPLANGKTPMWQAHICDHTENVMAGVLDGVFITGGFNRTPEQIVSIGADDYRLFININRSTPKHFFAIEEA